MPRIVMYCTDVCPYCQRAEKLLRRKGVKPVKVRVDGNRANLKEMIRRSRRKTVPQIFIGNCHIGGFDDLSELDMAGELDDLLRD
ncbi:MAG TPA: glutaredoxin 3 [Chromatiales bacterium]|nr:glutaredoxin 3 [Chromatiales bacterium]